MPKTSPSYGGCGGLAFKKWLLINRWLTIINGEETYIDLRCVSTYVLHVKVVINLARIIRPVLYLYQMLMSLSFYFASQYVATHAKILLRGCGGVICGRGLAPARKTVMMMMMMKKIFLWCENVCDDDENKMCYEKKTMSDKLNKTNKQKKEWTQEWMRNETLIK